MTGAEGDRGRERLGKKETGEERVQGKGERESVERGEREGIRERLGSNGERGKTSRGRVREREGGRDRKIK